jgi:4-amino-4-deoxy-L-arabinose transferase-like glycosyltransferase
VLANRKLDLAVLLLICFVAFWWRLDSLGLIDPDEPFYAQTAREMVSSNNWITPQIYGHPQFEKPILYYWMVAGSFKAFGETEFAGRLPTSIFTTVLVLLVWSFASRVWNRRTGFLAALVLATGLEYCVMSRIMLTDIPLATFIFAALCCYWRALHEPERRDWWMFWHLVWAGFAVLTKGPLGSLVTIMATLAFSIGTRHRVLYRGKGFWWGVVAYAVINVPWYGAMFAWYAKPFWEEFFVRDNFMRVTHAEHPSNNHWWYYIGLLFLGSLPWMPAVALMVKRALDRDRADESTFYKWCSLFVSVILLNVCRLLTPPVVFYIAVGLFCVGLLWWIPAVIATFRRAFDRQSTDEASYFQWCWLLTSLVFLTICQSKIPSYAFFLFIPLAILVGRALDELLERGFQTVSERRMVFGVAIFQCVVVGVFVAIAMADVVHLPLGEWLSGKLASLTRTLRPFDAPVAIVFGVLAVSLFFLVRRQLSTWVLVSSTASLGLLFGALTVAQQAVNEETSSKPVAMKMIAEREGNEPMLAGKFLARGIIFYTKTDMTVPNPQVRILAKKAQPFWAAHPLPVVVRQKGLRDFLKEHPSAIAGMRKGDWSTYAKEPAFALRDDFTEYGENIVVRAHAKKPTPTPPEPVPPVVSDNGSPTPVRAME